MMDMQSSAYSSYRKGSSMLRSDLIRKIAEEISDEDNHLDIATRNRIAESVVDTIFDEITQQLASGGRVELRGFGVFEPRKRDARKGRNPRTGQSVDVPPKAIPFFRAGKDLRESLQRSAHAGS